MSQPDVQIKRIQEKIQVLLKRHGDLQKENSELKKELERLSVQSTQQLRSIETLKQQVEVLKVSSGTWNDNDKKDFEKRISQYVREIDKCIALLSE